MHPAAGVNGATAASTAPSAAPTGLRPVGNDHRRDRDRHNGRNRHDKPPEHECLPRPYRADENHEP